MLFLVNFCAFLSDVCWVFLEIEFYQKCVGPRPFTLTCCRRWTTVSGGPSRPNKTHLFTRHFSAVHTVLQPIKDGAEGIRRQMLLAWRHQVDHIIVRLFHSGGSRHRNQQPPTGDEEQRWTPHVWKLVGWKVNWFERKEVSGGGWGGLGVLLHEDWAPEFVSRVKSPWMHLSSARDWLRAGLWCAQPVCQTCVCSSAAVQPINSLVLLITHNNSQIISETDDNEKKKQQQRKYFH